MTGYGTPELLAVCNAGCDQHLERLRCRIFHRGEPLFDSFQAHPRGEERLAIDPAVVEHVYGCRYVLIPKVRRRANDPFFAKDRVEQIKGLLLAVEPYEDNRAAPSDQANSFSGQSRDSRALENHIGTDSSRSL